jgi:chemotaxis protein CheD
MSFMQTMPRRARVPPPRAPPAGRATAAFAAGKAEGPPRKPGEASFFFYDAHFRNEAVKVLPGEFFVHDEDLLIMTTLGSCIAACLWDREKRVGGMNHFMLPEGAGRRQRPLRQLRDGTADQRD